LVDAKILWNRAAQIATASLPHFDLHVGGGIYEICPTITMPTAYPPPPGGFYLPPPRPLSTPCSNCASFTFTAACST